MTPFATPLLLLTQLGRAFARLGGRAIGTRACKFKGLSEIRIVFLDKHNQIIADEVQQTGTVESMCGRW